MPSSRHLVAFITTLLALLILPSPLQAQPASTTQATTVDAEVDLRLGGAAIVAARRTALDARLFHRPLDAATLRKWMVLSSQGAMAEFQLFLAPLAPQEQQFLKKIAGMPAPIVNRLPFADLRGVLKNGGLLSLYQEQKQQPGKIKHTTPALENELYGAYDCVFASVGPPNGSPRYGDVIIRLKDSVRENGWATPFSGMHFVSAIRHKDAARMQDLLAAGQTLPTAATNPLSLGFDDRLAFSHYVVTESEWNQALAYQAILVLRNAAASGAGPQIQQRFADMLATDDADRFWTLFIPALERGLPPAAAAAREPFGYLEGKFPDQLLIADFTAIEVPAERLDEARSWPEAQPHLQLIRPQAQ